MGAIGLKTSWYFYVCILDSLWKCVSCIYNHSVPLSLHRRLLKGEIIWFRFHNVILECFCKFVWWPQYSLIGIPQENWREPGDSNLNDAVHGCIVYKLFVVVVVKSLSCVWLFATPWTAACQAIKIKDSRTWLLGFESYLSTFDCDLGQAF